MLTIPKICDKIFGDWKAFIVMGGWCKSVEADMQSQTSIGQNPSVLDLSVSGEKKIIFRERQDVHADEINLFPAISYQCIRSFAFNDDIC